VIRGTHDNQDSIDIALDGALVDAFAPADDATAAARALLGALVESLAPVDFPSARADALRARVLERAQAQPVPVIRRAEEAPWIDFAPGIRLRPLRIDRAARTQTSLWDMSPGSTIPSHKHSGEEECLVLDGTLEYDGRDYHRGDFLLAAPGLHHTEFSTKTGTLLMLRSELTKPLDRVFAQAGL
jgi:anti-sigma factor ChrR (cupin superfamily)